MHPDCLQYRLTSDELALFNEQGYLVVEDALDPAMRDALVAAVDAIDRVERDVENAADKLLSVTDVIHRDNRFVELLDWSMVFPKVW